MTHFSDDHKFNMALVIGSNDIDNFIHIKVIELSKLAETIIAKDSVEAAIDFLHMASRMGKLPGLIFIDISELTREDLNFLNWYNELPENIQRKMTVITLFLYSADIINVEQFSFIRRHIQKPLTIELINSLKWP